MKRIVCFLSVALAASMAMAQKKVTVKAGTIVPPLQAVEQVKAADVSEGSTVAFKVVANVMADGCVAIPQGAMASGVVTEAKKSSLAGTKGRLTIKPVNLILPSGEQIYFSNTTVRITGKNRTPLAVVTGLFVWPCIFIPGSKAVMPVGYDVQAVVSANTDVTVQ